MLHGLISVSSCNIFLTFISYKFNVSVRIAKAARLRF